MKKLKKPQKIEKTYLDTLSYDEIQENIRRSILDNASPEEFMGGADAPEFCFEIENYLELRFPEKIDKIADALCTALNIPEERKEGFVNWMINNRKESEKNYKWII